MQAQQKCKFTCWLRHDVGSTMHNGKVCAACDSQTMQSSQFILLFGFFAGLSLIDFHVRHDLSHPVENSAVHMAAHSSNRLQYRMMTVRTLLG